MKMQPEFSVLPLFPELDRLLIDLLRGLTAEEWETQTVASLWKVKDVATHLLDGNLRALSMGRDGYFGEKPGDLPSYQALIAYLNELNATWVAASRRLSPRVLTDLLESTGQAYTAYLHSLDPDKPALFSVAWAGHTHSPNWFHIAREYTEKFLHQQQIRDGVGKPGLMVRELFYPFIHTLMQALPYTFREIQAAKGTVVAVEVSGPLGGRWAIIWGETGWDWATNPPPPASATVSIDPDTAWKLFSKSWKPDRVKDRVRVEGDQALALHALNMVAFMA